MRTTWDANGIADRCLPPSIALPKAQQFGRPRVDISFAYQHKEPPHHHRPPPPTTATTTAATTPGILRCRILWWWKIVLVVAVVAVVAEVVLVVRLRSPWNLAVLELVARWSEMSKRVAQESDRRFGGNSVWSGR